MNSIVQMVDALTRGPRPKVAQGERQRPLLEAMTRDWMSWGDIRQASGIDNFGVLAALVKYQKVERIGDPKHYLYRKI